MSSHISSSEKDQATNFTRAEIRRFFEEVIDDTSLNARNTQKILDKLESKIFWHKVWKFSTHPTREVARFFNYIDIAVSVVILLVCLAKIFDPNYSENGLEFFFSKDFFLNVFTFALIQLIDGVLSQLYNSALDAANTSANEIEKLTQDLLFQTKRKDFDDLLRYSQSILIEAAAAAFADKK